MTGAADRAGPRHTYGDDSRARSRAARALGQCGARSGRRTAPSSAPWRGTRTSTAHRARQVARSLDDVRTISPSSASSPTPSQPATTPPPARPASAASPAPPAAGGAVPIGVPGPRPARPTPPALRGRRGRRRQLNRRDHALARLDEPLAIATAPPPAADVAARTGSSAGPAPPTPSGARHPPVAGRAGPRHAGRGEASPGTCPPRPPTAPQAPRRPEPPRGHAPRAGVARQASSMSATLGGRGDEDVTLSAPERALIRRLGELRAAYAATRTELGRHHRAAIGDARLVAAPLGQLVGNPAVYEHRLRQRGDRGRGDRARRAGPVGRVAGGPGGDARGGGRGHPTPTRARRRPRRPRRQRRPR